MLRFALPLLAALSLPACIIVTRDPDDGDTGAGETGSADDGSTPACGDPETFSMLDEAGNCVCEAALVWCTADENDFSCCIPVCGDPGTNSEEVGNDECQCLEGFEWCTDDPDDITCCEV